MCARIEKAIKDVDSKKQVLPLSISIGYALRKDPAIKLEDIIKKADDCMYREKIVRGEYHRSSIMDSFLKSLDTKDYITSGHADRVEKLVLKMAEKLKLSQSTISNLRLLAKFHDVGKVVLPESLLFKPGPLTKEEYKEVQRHCEIGMRIAAAHPELISIAELILKHHEWWNGEGYPLGLKNGDIPIECRILAIVDAYDAMTSRRPYREPMSHEAAINELGKAAGTQFDPELVEEFIALFGKGFSRMPGNANRSRKHR